MGNRMSHHIGCVSCVIWYEYRASGKVASVPHLLVLPSIFPSLFIKRILVVVVVLAYLLHQNYLCDKKHASQCCNSNDRM